MLSSMLGDASWDAKYSLFADAVSNVRAKFVQPHASKALAAANAATPKFAKRHESKASEDLPSAPGKTVCSSAAIQH